MKKVLAVISFVILSAGIASAFEDFDCFDYYKFQNGIVFEDFHPEMFSYSPGEDVIVSYKLISRMDIPIVEGSVRAQILYNDHNEGLQLIDEFFVKDDIYLMPGDELFQEFSWTVPKGAKAGQYMVKVYFLVGKKFNLAGLSFIPYGVGVPGKADTFQVENPTASRIYFSKFSTKINGESYTFDGFSPILNASEPITIETEIVNEGEAKNLDLQLNIYKWDDLTDQPIEYYSQSKAIYMDPNSLKKITYGPMNLEPMTYQLRFIAVSGEEKSILKMRFSVGQYIELREGYTEDLEKGNYTYGYLGAERGRFTFGGLDRFPLQKGEKAVVFVCPFTSADYLTVFEGEGVVTLRADGETILSESFGPVNITPHPAGFRMEFTPQKDVYKAVLSFQLSKGSEILDEAELTYDYSKFPHISSQLGLILDKKEFIRNEILHYTITYSENKYAQPLEGEIVLYLIDPYGDVNYFLVNQQIDGFFEGNIKLVGKPGTYTLKVRELTHNLVTEKQFTLKEQQTINYLWLVLIIIISVLIIITWKVRT